MTNHSSHSLHVAQSCSYISEGRTSAMMGSFFQVRREAKSWVLWEQESGQVTSETYLQNKPLVKNPLKQTLLANCHTVQVCQLTNLLQLIRLSAPSQNILQRAATVHTTRGEMVKVAFMDHM